MAIKEKKITECKRDRNYRPDLMMNTWNYRLKYVMKRATWLLSESLCLFKKNGISFGLTATTK